MLYTTVVTDEEELLQINEMNRLNLKIVLSPQEQQEQGFITWLYNISLLKEMHELAPSIIVKDEKQIVGYALVTPKESSSFHPDLKGMIDNLEIVNYKNNPLSTYSFYLMGQVCIHKDFRGKGIFDMLFQKHKELYSNTYDMLVTEISTKNLRSQKAHEKVGFKTIHTYKDELDEWNVVVWDWRK
ncbi:MAG: GNAT family N-acetyltransferase [Chitinophagaceae bacterium]|nr:GNAT family N-acetyltransferase [Chitinophagaceae bacterium]